MGIDHERGCQGREYTCTCGYDSAQEEQIERLREALDSCACLLEGIAENALKEDRTVTWSMASVMAETARAALEGSER